MKRSRLLFGNFGGSGGPPEEPDERITVTIPDFDPLEAESAPKPDRSLGWRIVAFLFAFVLIAADKGVLYTARLAVFVALFLGVVGMLMNRR